VVAVAVQGPLPTFYRDAPLPTGRSEAELVPTAQSARLLVVGSGDLVGEYPEAGYSRQLSALGLQFFLNSLEWLAQEGQLGEVRGKAMPRLLTDVPREVQRHMQFINIATVPAFFATLGLFMMLRRRRRKEELAELSE
jgi:ABC-2 type transport system permease protein